MTAALLAALGSVAILIGAAWWRQLQWDRHTAEALAVIEDAAYDDEDDGPTVSVVLDGTQPDGVVTLRIDDLGDVHIPWPRVMRLAVMLHSAAAVAGVEAGHSSSELDAEHERAHADLREALRRARGGLS